MYTYIIQYARMKSGLVVVGDNGATDLNELNYACIQLEEK